MMIHKEKAHNLIEQMLLITNEFNEHIDFFGAKQCALIAVDEIIKDRQKDCGEDECFEVKDNSEIFIMYWEQIKKEIELL